MIMASERKRDEDRNPRPGRAEVGKLVERLGELRRRRTPPPAAESGQEPAFVFGDPGRVAILEARIEHLEAALEGLQDAVDRQAVLQDERIADLRRRTEPDEMARSLSEDARRRGL
jgi:hypothetical protein